jgi:hypothetical protein
MKRGIKKDINGVAIIGKLPFIVSQNVRNFLSNNFESEEDFEKRKELGKPFVYELMIKKGAKFCHKCNHYGFLEICTNCGNKL